MDNETIHTLPNGRKYKFIKEGEYKAGEYPTGGIKILAWDNRVQNRTDLNKMGDWLYIDNSPNEDCAAEFLKLAARLSKLD